MPQRKNKKEGKLPKSIYIVLLINAKKYCLFEQLINYQLIHTYIQINKGGDRVRLKRADHRDKEMSSYV